MDKLQAKIEAVLFIAAKPMTIKDLAAIIACTPAEATAACVALQQAYLDRQGGLALVQDESKYQLVSAPQQAAVVKEFVKQETTGELSKPSLETLTIIAYRGPIAKMELDQIRGINCALILRNLLIKGLIEMKSEKNESYYSVTTDFLKFLGLGNVHDLPDYEKLRTDKGLEQLITQAEQSI
jgi:segregation and condensation protein B